MPKQMKRESVNTTPSKGVHDDMLGAIFRSQNLDSMSTYKDESMDIDLTACVPINLPLLNGNSSSSADFWRHILDDNAQNSEQLYLLSRDPELSNDIAGFLRPEPPSLLYSPLKRTPVKSAPTAGKSMPACNPRPCMLNAPQQLRPLKQELPDVQMDNASFNMPNELPSPTGPDPTKESAFRVFGEQQQSQAQSEATSNTAGTPSSSPSTSATIDVNVEPITLCKNCNGQRLDKQDQEAHTSLGHEIKVVYRCPECSRDFESLTSLKKHARAHRSDNRKEVWKDCPDCGKSLKLGSMWMHRKIHTDNKKYSCDVCGQKFIQKINLTHHARIHSSEKPFECPECQKRFQERSHLQRHQKYHAQTRSFRCEKCNKLYKTERCLKVHNLVHLDQRPFACNMCDKSFISNSKLKQHTNIHTGNRPFKCKYCPRDFTNFPNWLKHTRRRHKVDHKTGERLENMPSYCAKKSSKNAKNKGKETTESKPATATSVDTVKPVDAPQQVENTSNVTAVAGVKVPRKKKIAKKHESEQNASVNNDCPVKLPVVQQQTLQQPQPSQQRSNPGVSTEIQAAFIASLQQQALPNNYPPLLQQQQQQRRNTIVVNVGCSSPLQQQLQNQHVISSVTSTGTAYSTSQQQRQLLNDMTTTTANFTTLQQHHHHGTMTSVTTSLQQQLQIRPTIATSMAGLEGTCAKSLVQQHPPQQRKLAQNCSSLQISIVKNKTHPTAAKQYSAVDNNKQTNAGTTKVRVKRERKQLTPKQMISQQMSQQQQNDNFLDIFGLSLTSTDNMNANDFFNGADTPTYDSAGITDSVNDNAISAEDFRIKQEIEADFSINDADLPGLPLKKTEIDRLACPSLESSPFSSPASIELVASSTMVAGPTYYMPRYALSTQSISNNGELFTSIQNMSTSNAAAAANLCLSVPQGFLQQSHILPSVETLFLTSGTIYATTGVADNGKPMN